MGRSFDLEPNRRPARVPTKPTSATAPRLAPWAATLLDLQRRAGNATVSRLVNKTWLQRKPADFFNTNTLMVDSAGRVQNQPRQRDAVAVSYPINRVLEKALIQHDEPAEVDANGNEAYMIGGHMFKAEYGGIDHIANVVPWNKKSEKAYTTFEHAYLGAVQKEAQKAGNNATIDVSTKAKFGASPGIGRLARQVLQDRPNREGETLHRRDLVRLIQSAYESVPNSIEASAPGCKTIKRTKSELMSAEPVLNKKNVSAELDAWVANGGPTPAAQKAIDKLKDWETSW